MHQVPSGFELAVIVGDFDAPTTDEIFEEFTVPEKLIAWWPKQAELEPKVGGSYVFSWPEQGWFLRGEYLAFAPGRHLAFTWSWDHEPARPEPQRVDIWFDRVHESGTRIGIFHGPFSDTPEDAAARQGVVEGWIHFCMNLGGLAPGKVD
jgi:uncharacterized protein YndB with AHSA1/START domain